MLAILSVWESVVVMLVMVALLCLWKAYEWVVYVNKQLEWHQAARDGIYEVLRRTEQELDEMKKKFDAIDSRVNSLHAATRDVIRSFEIDNHRG